MKVSTAEGLVLEELKRTFTGRLEISIAPNAQDKSFNEELAFLNDRLDKLDLRERRIKDAYQDGIDTLEEYKENKRLLECARKTVTDRLEKIRANSLQPAVQGRNIKQIESVYALLNDSGMDLEIKYKTAHFLINRIVYKKLENILEIEYK